MVIRVVHHDILALNRLGWRHYRVRRPLTFEL